MAKKIGRKQGEGVKYSKTVTKAVSNWRLDGDILNSNESAKELRKEINRVFHAANRRLQNIENSGVYSPAANAVNAYLGENDVSAFNSFAKFSTAGKVWTEIKRDYAAAIEFLKKPTSTVSGAKQFEREVMQRARLTPKQFEAIKEIIDENGGINEYAAQKALIPSDPTKVADFFQTAANDIADEIENAARNLDGANALKNALQRDLENDINSGYSENTASLHDAFENFED